MRFALFDRGDESEKKKKKKKNAHDPISAWSKTEKRTRLHENACYVGYIVHDMCRILLGSATLKVS